MNLSVELLNSEFVPNIVNYWLNISPEQHDIMGVDPQRLPEADMLSKGLNHQLSLPLEERRAFALIGFLDGKPVGHCNVNPITFGESALMHLHIWDNQHRKKGLGEEMVRQSIPVFFEQLELNELLCQPKASNTAPNKTLEKLGFRFVKKYRTIPGDINYEQEVNLWRFTKDQLEEWMGKED